MVNIKKTTSSGKKEIPTQVFWALGNPNFQPYKPETWNPGVMAFIFNLWGMKTNYREMDVTQLLCKNNHCQFYLFGQHKKTPDSQILQVHYMVRTASATAVDTVCGCGGFRNLWVGKFLGDCVITTRCSQWSVCHSAWARSTTGTTGWLRWVRYHGTRRFTILHRQTYMHQSQRLQLISLQWTVCFSLCGNYEPTVDYISERTSSMKKILFLQILERLPANPLHS